MACGDELFDGIFVGLSPHPGHLPVRKGDINEQQAVGQANLGRISSLFDSIFSIS